MMDLSKERRKLICKCVDVDADVNLDADVRVGVGVRVGVRVGVHVRISITRAGQECAESGGAREETRDWLALVLVLLSLAR